MKMKGIKMMDERRNAVIYARFSSDNQREESIEGQLRECKDFAEKNGYFVVGTYIDRAYSARTADRPDFQKMIKDSENKGFDYVIVWKLDRFSRDKYDSAIYKRNLKVNNVKVVSATENIMDTPEGVLLESVLEGLAQYYSADLSMKTIRGLTENALKCKFNGGIVPHGYYIDKDGHFQIDTAMAPFVVMAFNMYADGYTMQEIADHINALGARTQNGNPFAVNVISTMLRNRRYIGEYRFRDIVHPNGIPAIISTELFDTVQAKVEANKKAPAKHKAEDEYILSGKLFCGKCEKPVLGESGTSHTGTTYRYYKCFGAKKRLCSLKAVKKAYIEELVIQQIKLVIFDDELIGRIAEDVLSLAVKENEVLPGLKKQLAETTRGIDNILNAIEQGIITDSTKERLETLERAKKSLIFEIAKEEAVKPRLDKKQVVTWLKQFQKLNFEKHSHRRKLVDAFVNAIYVYDDKLILTLNYKDGTKTISLEEINSSTLGSNTSSLPLPKIDKFRQRLVDFTFSLLTLHFSLFYFETCRLGNK